MDKKMREGGGNYLIIKLLKYPKNQKTYLTVN